MNNHPLLKECKCDIELNVRDYTPNFCSHWFLFHFCLSYISISFQFYNRFVYVSNFFLNVDSLAESFFSVSLCSLVWNFEASHSPSFFKQHCSESWWEYLGYHLISNYFQNWPRYWLFGVLSGYIHLNGYQKRPLVVCI